MATIFNEDNTIEQMILSTLQGEGSKKSSPPHFWNHVSERKTTTPLAANLFDNTNSTNRYYDHLSLILSH